MSPQFKVLDLFCGAAGGWSLGLHRAGFATVAACEIDEWRRSVFAQNFPQARMYDDVRTLSRERLAADGIVLDVICGSPPCQDASTANPKGGKGIDGERTGLFWDAVRLVREMRPRWALLENVPALRTRGYDRIHDALEAAGYAVRPLVVGAQHAGANHRRNRVWIVANAPFVFGPAVARNKSDRPAALVADAFGARLEEPEGIASNAGTQRQAAERNGLCIGHSWNGGAPCLGGMDDGLPKGMARRMLSAYGDAVVPQIPYVIGRAILACERNAA